MVRPPPQSRTPPSLHACAVPTPVAPLCPRYHWSHLIQQAVSPTRADLHAVSNMGQCVFFGQEVLDRGQEGGHTLMMSPDAWHTNALRLYCGSQYRRNLAPYDAIEFYMLGLSAGLGGSTFR